MAAAPAARPDAAHPSVFEETYGYIIALAVMIAALVAINVLRSRKGGQAYIEMLRARLKATDALLHAGQTSRLRACWHCGAPEAPRRPVRLLHSIFGGVIAAGESVTVEVPLCPVHGEVNVGAHWARLLAPLIGALTAAIALALYPFPEGSGHFGWWLLVSLAAGIAVGVAMKKWANRVQTFRLFFLDTAVNVMIVRFNDAERAAAVRKEADAPPDPLPPGDADFAGGSG